ncbi:MAG: CDP-alcohol phosphatidyltransferase family protein [Flavobacteriaceae bacterium]
MKFIPNVLTLANAALGCCALFFIAILDYDTATLCVLSAAVFDFFDGFIARTMGWTSRFGAELDSLADVISFGVVPGALATVMLSSAQVDYPLIFLGFIITLASAYRLAKYNTSENGQSYFRGLPSPANALFWVGVPHLELDLTFPLLIGGIIVTSYLLNSSIVFYRLQFKNSIIFAVLILLIMLYLLFLWMRFDHGAWSIAISTYILLCVMYRLVAKSKG